MVATGETLKDLIEKEVKRTPTLLEDLQFGRAKIYAHGGQGVILATPHNGDENGILHKVRRVEVSSDHFLSRHVHAKHSTNGKKHFLEIDGKKYRLGSEAVSDLAGIVTEYNITRRMRQQDPATSLFDDRSIFTLGGNLCFSFPYTRAAGVSLTAYLQSEKGRSAEAFYTINRSLLEARDELVEAHIVHRDIKPHNIIVNSTGQVTLIDYGVALYTSEEEIFDAQEDRLALIKSSHKERGVIAGTPGYIAPETMACGPEARSPQVDTYAHGALIGTWVLGYAPSDWFADLTDNGSKLMLSNLRFSESQWADIRDKMIRESRLPSNLMAAAAAMFHPDPQKRSDESFRFYLQQGHQGVESIFPPLAVSLLDEQATTHAQICVGKGTDYATTQLILPTPPTTQLYRA